MKKLKRWIREQLSGLILWIAGPELTTLVMSETGKRLSTMKLALDARLEARTEKLYGQLRALQAIDEGCGKDAGKIIILSTIGGKDMVKIIDIARQLHPEQYRQIVSDLTQKYGLNPRFYDVGARTHWDAQQRKHEAEEAARKARE